MPDVTGWGRGDALAAAIAAGRRLGIAEARGLVNGAGMEAIADTLRFADELASADPVLAGAIRAAAYDVLHGRADGTVDGTATDVEQPAIEGGS